MSWKPSQARDFIYEVIGGLGYTVVQQFFKFSQADSYSVSAFLVGK